MITHKGATLAKREGGHTLYCALCESDTVKLEHSEYTYTASESDPSLHTAICGICNTVAESEKHTGGRASCTSYAVCEMCHKSYGEKNSSNHTSTEARYIPSENGHIKVRSCCEEELLASEHSYDSLCDTECNDCGATKEASHLYTADGICMHCGDEGSAVTEPDEPKKGAGAGAIIGTAVGTVIVVGAGAFAFIWFFIKRKTWKDLISVFKK